MRNVIRFKGKNNREQFVKLSEEIRKKQIFHRARLLDNQSVICYTDNIRGLEKLQEEEQNG